ncbi:MAG: SDR family oxidoreductase [Nitrososphaerota archaeon]|nr:SDR family oxidoreductase [Nitrososphaerota archaeon]
MAAPIPHRFDGKVVLVTASAMGICRGISRRFALEGADIVAVDINREGLDRLSNEIEEVGTRFLPIAVDATKVDSAKQGVERALSKFGKIDVLVNGVGRFRLRPMLETSEDEWESVMDINAKATFLWSKAIVKHMIDRRSGCIINIASDAGKVPDPYSGLYIAGKHAVVGMTKTLAVELASYGIRVNAVCPGYVDTSMTTNIYKELSARKGRPPEQLVQEAVNTIPLGRMAQPEDIAGVVTFLASDDAKYMTGQSINVTGGLLML